MTAGTTTQAFTKSLTQRPNDGTRRVLAFRSAISMNRTSDINYQKVEATGLEGWERLGRRINASRARACWVSVLDSGVCVPMGFPTGVSRAQPGATVSGLSDSR